MPNIGQSASWFSSHVNASISLFQNILKAHCKGFDADSAPQYPDPLSDEGMAIAIREMQEHHFFSMEDWVAHDVALFSRYTLSHENLVKVAKERRFPHTLHRILDLWSPSSFFYLCSFLWLYCAKSAQLFADLVALLPDGRCPSHKEKGAVLFSDMIKAEYYSEGTCAFIAGALIPYAKEMPCLRRHMTVIFELSPLLSPQQVGLLVRSLLFFQARPPECACGYAPYEELCACHAVRDAAGNLVSAYELDMQREYACILLDMMARALMKQDQEVLLGLGMWGKEERDLMLVSACEHVFLRATYVKLYHRIVATTGLPRFEQRFPRPPSASERERAAFQGVDAEEERHFQTGNCVAQDCKAMMKEDCANVSCGIHCPALGRFECRAHRFYPARKHDEARRADRR